MKPFPSQQAAVGAVVRGGKGLGWCQKVGERGMEEGKAK